MPALSIQPQNTAPTTYSPRKWLPNPSMKRYPSRMKREVVAVLGGSPNTNDQAYKVQQALAFKGHTPVPVNPFYEQVEGLVCFPDLLACPKKIDTVSVCVKPKILGDLLEDILEVMPRRVILNPGSECNGAVVVLREAGIDVVNACTLELLRNEQF